MVITQGHIFVCKYCHGFFAAHSFALSSISGTMDYTGFRYTALPLRTRRWRWFTQI